MRHCLFALAFLLAACGRPAPPAEPMPDSTGLPVANDEPGEHDNRALLAGALAEGGWTYIDRIDAAVFGPVDSEYVFKVECSKSTGHVRLVFRPDEAKLVFPPMRVRTADRTLEFQARGLDGVPIVSAGMNGSEQQLAYLAREQDRFAVQFDGQTIILPWDPLIPRALNRCAAAYGMDPWP